MMSAPVTCLAALVLATRSCWGNTLSQTAPASASSDQRQGGGAEVRCFCNLPQCVVTGYMCKSQAAGCFSDLSTYHEVYEAVHGCVDILDRDRQRECAGKPGAEVSVRRLRCCHRDMCNHVDSPEIRFMYNDSSLGPLNSSETTHLYLNNLFHSGVSGGEVWLKAATIAVPICGAVILLVLVCLALRILRKEQERLARHAASFYPCSAPASSAAGGHRSKKKASSLLLPPPPQPSCHGLDKNAANAKLNSAERQYSLLVPLRGDPDLRKPDNLQASLYRNVNLTFVAGKFDDERRAASWASHV